MNRDWVSWRSDNLWRDMPLIVYGQGGYPVVVFPTQNSPCTDFESFGMVDTLSDYIDGGVLQLFCVDTVDQESWSASWADKGDRAQRQEAYYRYICEEVIPFVHDRNGSGFRPLTTGCSMGATHAAICTLRRPDLFQGCIALSGVYDAKYFFDGWMDGVLYQNSPVDFLPNMSPDHPYVETYNRRQLVFCVGRGAWEDEGIRTQRILDDAFRRLGVNAWCDYWGFDVNHDWPWWRKQIRYFLPTVLDDMEKTFAEEGITLWW